MGGSGRMNLDKFGEGFWITAMFMGLVAILLITAMVTDTAIITVLGMIAAFWFPTRGQSTPVTVSAEELKA